MKIESTIKITETELREILNKWVANKTDRSIKSINFEINTNQDIYGEPNGDPYLEQVVIYFEDEELND